PPQLPRETSLHAWRNSLQENEASKPAGSKRFRAGSGHLTGRGCDLCHRSSHARPKMKGLEQWGTSMSTSAAQAPTPRASVAEASKQASPSRFVAILGFSMTFAAVSAAVGSLQW